MERNTAKHGSHTAHQTVTEEWIEVGGPRESIRIGFTDQKVSGRAGLATLAGFLHWHRFDAVLASVLEGLKPPRPAGRAGRPGLPLAGIALGFMAGLWSGARALAQVALLRGDPLVARVLALDVIPSQATLSRFFARFGHAGINQRAFRPLWFWCLDRLPSRPGGYSLDLDSTTLLHEDGHQEGVAVGHTRLGCKPCLHPLLAVLEEPKLVAGFWLRPGNTRSDNNVVNFTLELLHHLPKAIGLRVVRADSGFCNAAWLDLLESQGLRYIVVARLVRPLRQLCTKDTLWHDSPVPGTQVAEVTYKEIHWEHARRIILIRHRLADQERAGGKKLIEVEGYTFQALVTNLPASVPPIEVWRDYNPRAGCENVIKQLDADFALDQLCLKKFYATEAAMSLAVLAYNLCILFQRHLHWADRVTAATLRYRLFTTPGIISRQAGRTTIRLAVPPRQRPWWTQFYTRLYALYPFSNAKLPPTSFPLEYRPLF